MSSKTTWRLFLSAIALFAFIVFVDRRHGDGKSVGEQAQVFPKLAPATVNGVEIQSTNVTLRAEKTNDTWRLTRPFYPAQSTPIEGFLKTVVSLPKYDVISAQQVAEQQGKLKDFGLDPPLWALTLTQG